MYNPTTERSAYRVEYRGYWTVIRAADGAQVCCGSDSADAMMVCGLLMCGLDVMEVVELAQGPVPVEVTP